MIYQRLILAIHHDATTTDITCSGQHHHLTRATSLYTRPYCNDTDVINTCNSYCTGLDVFKALALSASVAQCVARRSEPV